MTDNRHKAYRWEMTVHFAMMRRSGRAALGIATVVLVAAGAIMLHGQGTFAASPTEQARETPVVVELFTSQGCYSCPPAEAMLSELARRDGIVALEHHVEYWDSLVYGSAGRWKDVFSSSNATERQRVYAQVVPGRGHSYTPQMVIDGRFEAVGGRDSEVGRAIAKAGGTDQPRLAVTARGAGAEGLQVRVAAAAVPGDAAAGVWLVRYLREHVTEVTRGENKGKTLTGRNIVREMTRIGDWHGGELVIDLENARPDAEHGCAVIVQPDGQGPILGAAYCALEPATNS